MFKETPRLGGVFLFVLDIYQLENSKNSNSEIGKRNNYNLVTIGKFHGFH
jgi:hypothetical protein